MIIPKTCQRGVYTDLKRDIDVEKMRKGIQEIEIECVYVREREVEIERESDLLRLCRRLLFPSLLLPTGTYTDMDCLYPH